MAEKFLEPQNPLKKIDETTGDVTYVYPLTTDKQVIMENGERLNTVLNENILYMGETDSETQVAPINVDTFGGQPPSYYASVDSVVKKSEFLDMVYPVGAIYMSINSTSPSDLFGGTWERIKDTFLLSAGDIYSAGATGGSATHTLTVDEMPSHTHKVANYAGIVGWTESSPSGYFSNSNDGFVTQTDIYSSSIGDSKPHNNMPPYLAVYVWQRIS